jgi:transcriptional regulator with XRE-family HTH domain
MRTMADEPWRRLAGAVRARRDALGWTQAELAARSGVSEPTIRVIETARRSSYQRATLRAIAEALGWPTDSPDRILRGEEPMPTAEDAAGRPVSDHGDGARIDALERQVAELGDREARLERVVAELSERWRQVQVELAAERQATVHELDTGNDEQAADRDAGIQHLLDEIDTEYSDASETYREKAKELLRATHRRAQARPGRGSQRRRPSA